MGLLTPFGAQVGGKAASQIHPLSLMLNLRGARTPALAIAGVRRSNLIECECSEFHETASADKARLADSC